MQNKAKRGASVVYHWDGEELHAVITKVWSNECVNLTVFESNGTTRAATSVQPVLEGQTREGRYTWPDVEPIKVQLLGVEVR